MLHQQHQHHMQRTRGSAPTPPQPPSSLAAAAAVAAGSRRHPHTTTRRKLHASATPSPQHSSGDAAGADGAAAAPGTKGQQQQQQPQQPQREFQPRALTAGLQRASDVHTLAHIWQQYQHQFNSFHFSVLMQQLTRLHEQVAAGVAQQGGTTKSSRQQQQPLHVSPQAMQQQQQQQQRSASLAELEQELGHLLDSSSSSGDADAAARRSDTAPAAASGVGSKPGGSTSSSSSSSSVRRVHSSRGLADLCPALDGYEHMAGTAAAGSVGSISLPPPQPQQLRWRSEEQQQGQQQGWQLQAGGGPIAASNGGSSKQPQLQRPQWQPPSGMSSSSTSSSSRPNKRHSNQRQQPPQQQQQQPLSDAKRQRQQQQIRRLAVTVAAAALQPERQQVLDNRALVMIAHNLAKMQLHSQPILSQLLQVLHAGQLSGLDAQQLTNLIWSVGSCVSSGSSADRGPYTVLRVPRGMATSRSSTRSTRSSSDIAADVPAAVAAADAAVGSVVGDDGSAADSSLEELQAAAASLASSWSEDLVMCAPSSSNSRANSSSNNTTYQPPESWLAGAADSLLQLLPQCSSQGVAMALWGFAQLGFSPSEAWWGRFWGLTQESLQQYGPQDLALMMCALGKLGPEVPSSWLSAYCSAAVEVLPSMSTQQLTMCLWGLAAVGGASPHKAFVLLWFLQSKWKMEQATTQELSMWLYALTLLRLTPAPTWCVKFVEASFAGFTAPDTRPQDLVTAMWSISKLGWSPPLLYWRGLMEAAQQAFTRFGPQDLANCVSAAAVVDISCMSDAWLSSFIKVSQPLLPAFAPVQLAHTANALAIITKTHPSAYRLIHAAWQDAFVRAAAPHLAAGAFSARNLCLVASSLQVLQFKPQSVEVQQFLVDVQAAISKLRSLQQRPLAAQQL